jgi:hypothetical protein
MIKNICIFCSSSNDIDKIYYKNANTLASLLVKTDCSLIFGGGMIGLMGEFARVFKANNRQVISVIPKRLNKKGIIFEDSTRIIEIETINERKLIMQNMSDAFIALPGGFGTLEELLEVISSKQLGFHNKPIAILNVNNFFKDLFAQFDKLFKEKFTDARYSDIYCISESPQSIVDYLNNYVPKIFENKLPFM